MKHNQQPRWRFNLAWASLTALGLALAAPSYSQTADSFNPGANSNVWALAVQTNGYVLVGGDFTKSLSADDIVDVPEFFEAYMQRNSGFKDVGFPSPKYKEKDKEANPEKYKQQKEEFRAAIRKFIIAVPESVQGIDLNLNDINPSVK